MQLLLKGCYKNDVLKKFLISILVLTLVSIMGYKELARRKALINGLYADMNVKLKDERDKRVYIEYNNKDILVKDLLVAGNEWIDDIKGRQIIHCDELQFTPIKFKLLSSTSVGDKVEKDVNKFIIVRDTQEPIIDVKEEVITLDYGEEYDLKENVDVYDKVDGELQFSEYKNNEDLKTNEYTIISDFDNKKAGTYEAEVIAVDKNNLRASSYFKIKVKQKPNKVSSSTASTNLNINKPYITCGSYSASLYGSSDPDNGIVNSIVDGPGAWYDVINGVEYVADHNYQGASAFTYNNSVAIVRADGSVDYYTKINTVSQLWQPGIDPFAVVPSVGGSLVTQTCVGDYIEFYGYTKQ